MKRAKRSTRKDPPGFEVFCQWFVRPSDEARAINGAELGDFDPCETKAEARSAAWDEYEEMCEAAQARENG